MATIENKSASVKVPGVSGIREVKRMYSDLIIEAVNNPPETGFTVKEMRIRLSIVEICEAANGTIKFDNEDQLKKVRDCVEKMTWRFLSSDILDFVDTILKA